MEQISVSQLNNELKSNKHFQLIDIRESYELVDGTIQGAIHIPMGNVTDQLDQLSPDNAVCVVCQSGKRASALANLLEIQYGYSNVYYLEGGMDAYSAAHSFKH